MLIRLRLNRVSREPNRITPGSLPNQRRMVWAETLYRRASSKTVKCSSLARLVETGR